MLDACILVPAPLRDTLLRTADAGLYRVRWSDAILDELERTLTGEDIRLPAHRAKQLRDQMTQHFPDASVGEFEHLIDRIRNDPKDRHVAAAAVVGKAEVIVTSNLRHFPASVLSEHRIRSESPDDFLVRFYYTDVGSMIDIVRQQAADLKKPSHTIDEVLNHLALNIPRFVELIRRDLNL